MEWYEMKIDHGKSVKFPEKVFPLHNADVNHSGYVNKLGGIIKRGEWAWLAKEATLHIVSLKYGHTVSTFEFAESKGYDNCVIKCADQVFPNNADGMYLAVCLDSMNSSGGSFVAIFSVDHSTVLSCMEVKLRITCCRFMESTVCRRSLLQNYDGCLALGSMEGVIVLLDLNMEKILSLQERQALEDVFIPCHVVDYNMPLREIHRNFKQCQQDGIHFGLQMEVMDAPCSVQCLLPIDLTLSLAIGLEDGRLILYDLAELQIFHIVTAEQQQEPAPLVKIDFLEPPDDPRPCLYIWALHEGDTSLTAILHSLMYEKRVLETNEDDCFLEAFQTSKIRLILPLESNKSIGVSCQSITKNVTHSEDDSNCLCALSWYAETEQKNKLLIFDLNQWYKDEMPFSIDTNRNPNFLAAYILNGKHCALQSYINPATIAHFNSIQRFEEHFYPNSLSHDCALLMQDSCLSYNWEGVQNRFINVLRSSNATIFLEPNTYFDEILRTKLMPQFCELNAKSTFSTQAKYEVILSVALEYNCFSLLRDCAKCWVDGSFMGNFSTTSGITLSTLTDWIWKRATDIKTRCNDLCKGLFDFGGFPLDQREQKELGFISRQLKLLADLQAEVLTFSKRNIPDKVHTNLGLKYKSLRMASDYQDLLLWLFNIGLLPEASPYSSKVNLNDELVPYPYRLLKDLYANKRAFFGKISDSFISKKTGSCRLLYIDAFIEHECKGNVLREHWLENNGDGLYPPTSIESMLRVMLVPEMSYDSKCAVMLYFFLDLNMTINDEAYKNVVAHFIKFPSVFKLTASLIKTVQAFWNLDHGHFLPSVDEFISPFNKNQDYPQWLLELLIETLLTQNASNLALRILEARSCLISPVLKLQTLMANELISEAFHFARSKQDDALLQQFFKCCLCDGKFGVLRDLALSEKEGQLVQDILRSSKTENAENLHFVYLLQKSKYIEAVSYMDEISKSKSMRSNLNSTTMTTPNMMMSAYSTTMTPVTQGLTDVYFRIKNKIRKKETDNRSPVPLSCQLIKQNANQLLGGIYHSSALSAHFATYYWGEMDETKKKKEDNRSLLSSNNAPFLRKPQLETNFLDYVEKNTISYPRTYKFIEKRTLTESDIQESSENENQAMQENPKKRRKLLGDEIIKNVSHFMQMTKNSRRLNNSEFSITGIEKGADIGPDAEATDNFLTQPPLMITRCQQNEIATKTTARSLASTEIHGILKTNTPEPLDCLYYRKDLPGEEEAKNIRFKLPSIELERMQKQEGEQVEKSSEESEVILEVPMQHQPIKTYVRSVSAESSISSSSSSKDASEENFYSPLSSQNNSIVLESVLNQSQKNASTFAEGPKARNPIPRHSVELTENFKTAEFMQSLHSSNDFPKEPASIVIKNHEWEPQAKEEQTSIVDSKTSSGFLSLASVPTENLSPAITISSVLSLASNIQDFVPQISSSKVCATQSKFTSETTVTKLKISEHSTVIGGITYMESTVDSSKEILHSEKDNETAQELDTTLGMSSYDLTLLDATSVPKTKSPLKIIETTTQSQGEVATEISPNEDNDRSQPDIYADLKYDDSLESEHSSNVLFDISMGLNDQLVTQNSSSLNEKNTPSVDGTNAVKGDGATVIVLSSSDDEQSSSENTNSDLNKSAISYDEYEDPDEETSNTGNDSEEDEDDVELFVEELSEDTIELAVNENEETTNDIEYEEMDDQDDVDFDMEEAYDGIEMDDCQEDTTDMEHADECQEYNKEIKVTTFMENADENKRDLNIVQFGSLNEEVAPKESPPQTEETCLHDEKLIPEQEAVEDCPFKEDSESLKDSIKTASADNVVDDIIIQSNLDTNLTASRTFPDELLQTREDEKLINTLVPDETNTVPIEKADSIADEVFTNKNPKSGNVKEPIDKAIVGEKVDMLADDVVTYNSNSFSEVEPKNEKILSEKAEAVEVTTKKEVEESVESIQEIKTKKCPENVQDISAAQSKQVTPTKSIKVGSKKLEEIEHHVVIENKDDSTVFKALQTEKEKEFENTRIEVSTELKIARTVNILPTISSSAGTENISQLKKGDVEAFDGKNERKTTSSDERSITNSSPSKQFFEAHTTAETVATPKRHNTRAASIDKETAESLTPRTRRSMRASSLQPRSSIEENEQNQEIGTPNRARWSAVARGTSVPPTIDSDKNEQILKNSHSLRGTSVPTAAVALKITSRRRSTFLDAISEDPNILDSPSTRTRSRARLNSMENELDTSLVPNELVPKVKRTRKTSFSSNVSEQPTSTPTKRTRQNSTTSQPDTGTPRTLRARSVTTNQDEAGTTPKILAIKRKISTNEKQEDSDSKETSKQEEEVEHVKHITASDDNKHKSTSPKVEDALLTSSYSSSRRLTRTQLAMLEKSAALSAVSVYDLDIPSSHASKSKRVTKRPASRSSAASQQDSDDAESIASHMSNNSNQVSKRRVTRSSVKDKDEVDDDLASVISSVGSEKHGKRRSNESKGSPGTHLAAIPEDSDANNIGTKKRTRRTKHQ